MAKVRSSIGVDAFNAWIAPTCLEDFNEEQNSLLLSVPNEFYRRWIEKRYMGIIAHAFSEVVGAPLQVTLTLEQVPRVQDDVNATPDPFEDRSTFDRAVISSLTHEPVVREDESDEEVFTGRGGMIDPVEMIGAETPVPAATSRLGSSKQPRLNPRYQFEEYIVGESNRYAHAAALAVSDPKGKAFNPLFIYGGCGLGKTHLMQAIGHRMHRLDRRLNVLYVTSEQFINHFIDAIQNRKHLEFRASYRNVDLLLIDDVQFLMGKDRTQQEFFHTFNALYDSGKKVVVTSDRPPRELAALEERLRSRFEWGLLVDIQSPDLETRIAILRKKAQAEGIQLPSEVILFIAEHITENIREMEGALKRLKVTSSLREKPIDLETARDVLSHLLRGSSQPRVNIEEIQRAVCQYFSIRQSDLLGKNRSKKFSQPRHVAQYLCRKLTDFSFPDIAQKFGGKDHTSVIYACRKVERAAQKDSNMSNIIDYLTRQISKGSGGDQQQR